MARMIVLFSLLIGLLLSVLFAQESEPAARPGGEIEPSTSPHARSAPLPVKAPFDARQAKARQAAWAKHLGTTVESTNSLGMKMVLIPPGEFMMGSTDEQVEAAIKMAVEIKADQNTQNRIRNAERPQHSMTLDKPYLMAATEVTIGQFRKFVNATKYVTQAEEFGTGNSAASEKASPQKKNGFTWRTPGFAQQEDAAVSQVTWNDAVVFCNWLSKQEKLQVCYRQDAKAAWLLIPRSNGYRLPSEAQWEFACRAGTTTQYHFGDDYQSLSKYGWFNFKSGSNPVRAVGSKLPNAFGLHDMHGNIGEWCQDYYDPKFYQTAQRNDPSGPSSGSRRVIRGGDWWTNAVRCRSAFRGYGEQVTRSDDLGFRVSRLK